MCFDAQDRKKFLGLLKKRFEDIKNNMSPKPLSSRRESWKCTKLCHFYKNNWPGTNISMCEHVEEHLKAFGHDDTVERCSRDGFEIGYYEAPG